MTGLHSPLREGRQLDEKNHIRKITRSPCVQGEVVATSAFDMILLGYSRTLGGIKKVAVLPSPNNAPSSTVPPWGG